MTPSPLSCLFMSRCMQSSSRNHPLQVILLPRLGKRSRIFVTWEERGPGSAAGQAEYWGRGLPGQLLQRGSQPEGEHSNSVGTPGVLSHAPCQGRVLQEPACLGDSSPAATHLHPWGMTTKQKWSWTGGRSFKWWHWGKESIWCSITYSQVGIFCSPAADSVRFLSHAAVQPFRNL